MNSLQQLNPLSYVPVTSRLLLTTLKLNSLPCFPTPSLYDPCDLVRVRLDVFYDSARSVSDFAFDEFDIEPRNCEVQGPVQDFVIDSLQYGEAED